VFARSSWAVSASRIYPCCHARASEWARETKWERERERVKKGGRERARESARARAFKRPCVIVHFHERSVLEKQLVVWADELQEIEILKKTSKF
jgi:hypothetical protein